MEHKAQRIHRVVRHGERLHRDIANRKLRAGRKQSPVATSLRETAGPKCLGCESIAVNRQIEFVTENFETTDVVSVFVRENNAVELFRHDATLLQTQQDLARAETAINENLAMIGCN